MVFEDDHVGDELGGARIFERYWSTAEATDDGLGIGLAVVAQVAEAHGGIYVESPVADGTGTRFTLHLGRRPPPV